MAKDVIVSAKVPKNEEKGQEEIVGQVTVQFTDDIEEAISMFGAAAILTNAFANWRVTVQGNVRSALKKGVTGEALQNLLGAAKMGVAQAGATVDPVEAYVAMYHSATPDKQKEMLARLKEDAAK